MTEMGPRAYHFTNFYLSQIQHGIQTAHCQTGMVSEYIDISIVEEWLQSPTTIILNGGNNASMIEIVNFVRKYEWDYPVGWFVEDEESLGGLLTNVGIVIPYKIWGAKDKLIVRPNDTLSELYAMRVDNEQIENRFHCFEMVNGLVSKEDMKLADFLQGFKLA